MKAKKLKKSDPEPEPFKLTLRDGAIVYLPTQGKDSSLRPDFYKVPPCYRCGGHGNAEGSRCGGTMSVIQLSPIGIWEIRARACDCIFGASLHAWMRLAWYDDSPRRLEGLTENEIGVLWRAKAGLDSLLDACDRIPIEAGRGKIKDAVVEMLERERSF